MQRFTFVSCHDGPIDRLRIRSHCMKGRNRREGSRRSLRRVRQSENASQPGALFQLPPPLDPSIARFASRVNKPAHEVLHQVLAFSELSTHPVEVCVDFDPYKTDRSAWLLDDAFLSTVLLSISALRDYALQQALTTGTRLHLVMTLALLNDKLSFSNAHLLDSNIYLTLCLAVMAGIFGDGEAIGAHLSGLQKMVALRGGSLYFKRQPKLQHKLESLDLLWCLSFGGEPRFLREPVDWEPYFHSGTVDIPLELFDSRLSAAFCDVRHLSALVNAHHEQKTRLSADLFQPALSSCQTRLLLLKDSLDPLSNWLCLGILAFLTTTFRLPGRKLQYPHLASQLRRSCERLDTRPQTLLFWFLIVSGLAVEPWLHKTWKRIANPDLSWDDARVRLQRVMWIGCIQDELGKQTFSALQTA